MQMTATSANKNLGLVNKKILLLPLLVMSSKPIKYPTAMPGLFVSYKKLCYYRGGGTGGVVVIYLRDLSNICRFREKCFTHLCWTKGNLKTRFIFWTTKTLLRKVRNTVQLSLRVTTISTYCKFHVNESLRGTRSMINYYNKNTCIDCWHERPLGSHRNPAKSKP